MISPSIFYSNNRAKRLRGRTAWFDGEGPLSSAFPVFSHEQDSENRGSTMFRYYSSFIMDTISACPESESVPANDAQAIKLASEIQVLPDESDRKSIKLL